MITWADGTEVTWDDWAAAREDESLRRREGPPPGPECPTCGTPENRCDHPGCCDTCRNRATTHGHRTRHDKPGDLGDALHRSERRCTVCAPERSLT